MSKLYEQQLETMKRLINYGVNENKSQNSNAPVVEFHTQAADGKTYGIIRECNKFYIKVAPKKDTPILAEDYEYIGGFMNRKNYEYASYPLASRQFDLKIKNINENYNVRFKTEQFKPVETTEWIVNETKEMRQEINRYNEIVNNVGYILKENKEFTMKHTLPEAPSSNPSEKEVNSPYTDTAVYKGDKDFKEEETNHEKAGGPYKENVKVDMTSDKNKKGSSKETYSEKAKYVPDNSIADKKPSGGKAVKMNEGKKVIKLTEEQVLAWSDSKDYQDKSHGTEIGDTAPYIETPNISESEAMYHDDNLNNPKPGVGEVGDTAPYDTEVNEEIVDVEDVAGMPDDVPFPEVEYNTEESDDMDLEDDENVYEIDSDLFEENLTRIIEGVVLNDFGKHPAYRKTPMTLPNGKEDERFGTDWNDDSAKSQEPFGKQIGSSAPYTEEFVDMLTDAIYNKIKKKS